MRFAGAFQTVLWSALCVQSALAYADDLPPPGTITGDILDSHVIFVGNLTNVQGDANKGTTDLVIERILKGDQELRGKKLIKIERFVKAEENTTCLTFGTVKDAVITIHRGIHASPAFVEYTTALIRIDGKNRDAVFKYCYSRLQHKDPEIAKQALNEFYLPNSASGFVNHQINPKLRQSARHFDPNQIRRWIAEKDGDAILLNIYCYMLGSCGTADDASLICKLIADRFLKENRRFDDMLIGQIRLSPKDGWAFARELLEGNKTSFMARYSAYCATKHFLDDETGVVAAEKLFTAIRLVIDQDDFADLPIEYLRQRRTWTFTEQILGLEGKKAFKTPIVKRTVVRYALQCPERRAKEFLEKMRRIDPELVSDVEELLKWESPSQK